MSTPNENEALLNPNRYRFRKQRTTSTESIFSSAKSETPEFGAGDWWVLNMICLLTILLLSTWQVSGKSAMTLKLETPDEVSFKYLLSMNSVFQVKSPYSFQTELPKTYFSMPYTLYRSGSLFPILALEPRSAARFNSI